MRAGGPAVRGGQQLRPVSSSSLEARLKAGKSKTLALAKGEADSLRGFASLLPIEKTLGMWEEPRLSEEIEVGQQGRWQERPSGLLDLWLLKHVLPLTFGNYLRCPGFFNGSSETNSLCTIGKGDETTAESL